MSDDLTTRLRAWSVNDWPTMHEAATEIERLRAEVERLTKRSDFRWNLYLNKGEEFERAIQQRNLANDRAETAERALHDAEQYVIRIRDHASKVATAAEETERKEGRVIILLCEQILLCAERTALDAAKEAK
jgi:hypothetical protein